MHWLWGQSKTHNVIDFMCMHACSYCPKFYPPSFLSSLPAGRCWWWLTAWFFWTLWFRFWGRSHFLFAFLCFLPTCFLWLAILSFFAAAAAAWLRVRPTLLRSINGLEDGVKGTVLCLLTAFFVPTKVQSCCLNRFYTRPAKDPHVMNWKHQFGPFFHMWESQNC